MLRTQAYRKTFISVLALTLLLIPVARFATHVSA